MPSRYAGEVWYAQGCGRGSHTIHIREQTQIERNISEDGAEDCGSLENEAGWIQDAGGTNLHETRSIMKNEWLWDLIGITLIAVIMMVALA